MTRRKNKKEKKRLNQQGGIFVMNFLIMSSVFSCLMQGRKDYTNKEEENEILKREKPSMS